MPTRRGVALRRILFALVVCLGGATFATAGSYSWTTAGPESGTIRQILIDPQNTNRLLAADGYYGPYLFETVDRGGKWTYNDRLVGFGRLIQDPFSPGSLYSGTYGGVWKSTDGGRTWALKTAGLPPAAAISAMAAAPAAPDSLFAVTQNNPAQLYRSLDAGETWSFISSSLATFYVNDLAGDPLDPQILYAAADLDVFKSVDGGLTFAPTGLNHSPRRLVIDGRPPATLYVGTSDAGIFRSPDGGITWIPANAGMENHVIWEIALDSSNPLKLFAASNGGSGSPGGLFVTPDGGQTWEPVDFGLPTAISTHVVTDPTDPSRVYAGAGTSVLKETLFASDDGGATWTAQDDGLSGYYSYGVARHPTEGGSAFGVSGPRVFRTDDSGSGWTELADTGVGLTSLIVDPSDAATLYASYGSPTGQGVLKSVDGGTTWNPAQNGLATSLLYRLAISPSAPQRLLGQTLDGLFGTLDGGGLWSSLLAGDVHAAAFDPVDSSILYAGLFSSSQTGYGFFRSPDGGVTWAPPDGIPVQYFHATDIAAPANDPSRVYVSALTGVFRSVDRGVSFAPAGNGLPIPGIQPFRLAADPARAGTVYMLATLGGGAATDAPQAPPPGNLFRTIDGADSWAPLPGFLPVFASLDFSISSSGRTLYAATLGGIFQFERGFLDVPDADPFWASVDAAAMNGVTVGCGEGNFCPDAPTLRSSIAVFLLRGKNGMAYVPPPATGTVFGDVTIGSPAADYIEELFHEGVAVGCGGGNYCPSAPLSRAEASVLLLKMEHGGDYEPPPATGTVFGDVPADAFAAAWIEQLALEGVTAGCGGGNFCPDAPVSRAQAAAFVVLLFSLS